MTVKPALICATLLTAIAATHLCAQTTLTETAAPQSTEAAVTSLRRSAVESTSTVVEAEVTTATSANTASTSALDLNSPAPADAATTSLIETANIEADKPQHQAPTTTATAQAHPAPESPQPEQSSPEIEPQPTAVTTASAFPPPPPQIPESEVTSVTLNDGLTYQVLRPGTGRDADTTSTRRIHYTLWRADGTYVESSRQKEYPKPFEFVPNTAQAIVGMQQGTETMRVGEIRKVYIPARLAYGNQERPNLPANSDLIFLVELVDLVTPDPTE